MGDDLLKAKAALMALKTRRSPGSSEKRVDRSSWHSPYGIDPAAQNFEHSSSTLTPARCGGKKTVRLSGETQKIFEITASATFDEKTDIAGRLNYGLGESIDDRSEQGSRQAESENYSNTFEDISSEIFSTPPRSRSRGEQRPALTTSPSTTAASATKAAPLVVRKPSSRVSVSPTRDRADSEFSKKLELDRNESTPSRKVEQQVNDVRGEDEWKEAKTPEGKSYYYNRRTRESAWRPPNTGKIISLVGDPPLNKITPQRPVETVFQAVQQVPSPSTILLGGLSENKIQSPVASLEVEATEAFEFLLERFTADHSCFLRFIDFCATERKQFEESSAVGLDESQSVVQCQDCGRTFARAASLAKHRIGCRTIQEKRTPTDFSRRRVGGTPAEFTLASPAKVSPNSAERPKSSRLLR